jgi:hypothetical protein
MNNSTKTGLIIFILVLLTGGLLYVDYNNDKGANSPSFFTSTLRNWFRPRSITADVLGQTSLKESDMTAIARTSEFFSPYLELPDNLTADRYSIDETSIMVYEVQVQNPFKIMKTLLSQESSRYKFNQIDSGTFYLNQVPADQKTHNFLAIVINNVLYGYRYDPVDHRKVLEIIDVLQKTE